ncbi:hypothetical protein F4782DRAFT_538934 [Xylaria castorea]|nr:hypothetical protein F4782DRAFT_538934 [Xylaria castorea]
MSVPRIVELAQPIATNTAKVSEHLAVNNLSQPSLDLDGPIDGPLPKYSAQRSWICHNPLLPQQVITRETTFAEMAASSSLAEMTQRIFEETRPGVITHSTASRLLAEDSGVHDYVASCSDELWQAAAQTCNAMAQFPGSQEPTETGFSLANNTDKSMYEFLSGYPERSRRFANTMRGSTNRKMFDLQYITDFYFLGSAYWWHYCRFITNAQKSVLSDVASRVSFMAHDSFRAQPILGADVYFFQ